MLTNDCCDNVHTAICPLIVLEFLENHEKVFHQYYIHSNVCNKYSSPLHCVPLLKREEMMKHIFRSQKRRNDKSSNMFI